MQQTECGFHGHAYHPYRDVGQVELDDPSLILGGLGQKQDGQVINVQLGSKFHFPSTLLGG